MGITTKAEHERFGNKDFSSNDCCAGEAGCLVGVGESRLEVSRGCVAESADLTSPQEQNQ